MIQLLNYITEAMANCGDIVFIVDEAEILLNCIPPTSGHLSNLVRTTQVNLNGYYFFYYKCFLCVFPNVWMHKLIFHYL